MEQYTYRLKIVSNGKYTLALLYNNKGDIKQTLSSCHPDDTFSLFEGVRLCINRMTNYRYGKVKYVSMEPDPEMPMRDLISMTYPDNCYSCVDIRMMQQKDGLFRCEVRRVRDLYTDKLELDMTGGRWPWGDMREDDFLKKCRECMKEIAERTLIKELEAVTKAYIEKRDEVKAKFSGDMSLDNEKED